MMRMYDKQNRRLIYIEEMATPDFWDSRWDVANFKLAVEKGKNDRPCLNMLHKYIPDKRGRILEGGCGVGKFVYCMHAHGYEAIGVDFAEKTIQRVKAVYPELDVRVGDVKNLPFPDNYFTAYMSFGVIEHCWHGYHDVLREMQRVLIKGGYLFLTFPYMSLLRMLKAKFNLYEEFPIDNGVEDDFYQFVLDAKIVIKNFEENGFRLLGHSPTDGIKGFIDEVNLLRPWLQRCRDYKGQSLYIKGFRFLLDKILAIYSGHGIRIVFQKV